MIARSQTSWLKRSYGVSDSINVGGQYVPLQERNAKLARTIARSQASCLKRSYDVSDSINVGGEYVPL